MKKGLHPALQVMNIVAPDGRLMEVLISKIYNNNKRYWALPSSEEARERVGQVAKFRRRYSKAFDEDEEDNTRLRLRTDQNSSGAKNEHES
eukprot:c21438_g1_i1 orf=190-462(+)